MLHLCKLQQIISSKIVKNGLGDNILGDLGGDTLLPKP